MGMGTAPLPVEKLGNLQECAKAICALPLESTPGERVSYSASMGFTILGDGVADKGGNRGQQNAKAAHGAVTRP